jgi:hypothetical protein
MFGIPACQFGSTTANFRDKEPAPRHARILGNEAVRKSPNRLHEFVILQALVCRYKRQIIRERLRNQHPVKGVAMQFRKPIKRKNVSEIDREHFTFEILNSRQYGLFIKLKIFLLQRMF